MGILNGVNFLYKELTGRNNLERAQKRYEEIVNEYNFKAKKYNENCESLKEIIAINMQLKQECINLIQQYKNMFYTEKKINAKDYQLDEFNQHEKIISNTKSEGFGTDITALAIGGGLSTLTYIFASSFGIASTGTAIASLSGAAATNATLAFLGGGALAVGGGGMVAGATLLGGIALAPLALLEFYKTTKNYSKARELNNESDKLDEEVKKINLGNQKIERVKKEISFFNTSIEKIKNEYYEVMEYILLRSNSITDSFINLLEDFSKIETGHFAADIDEKVEEYLKKNFDRKKEFYNFMKTAMKEQLKIINKF